jgi:hypothetical protein
LRYNAILIFKNECRKNEKYIQPNEKYIGRQEPMDLRFPDNADIADILSDLNDPANYHGYLRTMSHFSGHSWHNIYCIYKQMPHASKLADFNNWKEQHGRTIKQGSKSIKIYMPAGQLPKKRLNEETTAESPAKYKQYSLFDITQTKGSPIYRLAGDVMSNDSLKGVFADVLKTMCTYSFSQINYYDAIGQIVVERFENADSLNDDFIILCVAYVVCLRFGVGVGNIALHIRIDEKTLETIGRQADSIIIDIENIFAAACKERGLDPMTLHNPPTEPTSKIEKEITAQPEPSTPPNQATAPIEPPASKYPPDVSITMPERDRYGYARSELLPLNRERAVELFLRDMTVYLLHKNNTESIARYISDIQDHDGIFGVTHSAWHNSRECIALSSGDPEARQETKFIKELPVFIGEESRQNRRKTEIEAAENVSIFEKQNNEVAIPAKHEKESNVTFAGDKIPQTPPQTETPPASPIPPETTRSEGSPPTPPLEKLQSDSPETKMDIECAEAIANAIQAHKKSGSRYDMETPAGMLTKKYGKERMKRVLSTHILSHPKGFTDDTFSWAERCMGNEPKNGGKNPAIAIDTHYAVLEAFVDEIRIILEQKPTFSEKMEYAKKKSHAHNESKR